MTWISPYHAAALLGISERHLRRIAEQYTTRARDRATEYLLESLPAEAQKKFFDSAAAEPSGSSAGASPESPGGRLPAVASSATLSGDSSLGGGHRDRSLNDLGEDELAALNNLADALRQFQIANSKFQTRTPSNLESGICNMESPLRGMSPSTIRRKIRALDKYGVAGLARKTRKDRGRARVADDKVVARIKSAYLRPHRPTAASIYRDVRRDYEMSNATPPSYSFVLRTIDQLDDALIARFRHGEREFDDKFAYVTMRAKPAAPRLWCDADHHLIDHVVEFADGSLGRPWLTAIQDICTNEITGYILSREKRASYPGARAIGLCLRKAILPKDSDISRRGAEAQSSERTEWPSFGLFENFYSDLGKDFRSQYIRAVCHDLGINVRYARGYHGKSKPIERFFGTLENGIKDLPAYVGRNPETNPLKAHIGASRAWESLRGEAMKIDDFEAALRRWIVNVFHHTESKALKGMSPIGALESHVKNGWSARAVASERALDLLLMSRSKKKVQRFGIQLFSSLHTQRYFMAPELIPLINDEVEVFWNPENIGEVIVYHQNKFVCKAANKELLGYGATEEDLKSEREIKKTQRDQVRARLEELQRRAQYPNEMARAVAENRLDKVIEEEREKIAVNAQAPSVPMLMPKYQHAAASLARQVGAKNISPVRNAPRPAADDLKSSAELFQKPPRPAWMEDDDE